MPSFILFDSSIEEEDYEFKIIINSLQSLNIIIPIGSYNLIIRLEEWSPPEPIIIDLLSIVVGYGFNF